MIKKYCVISLILFFGLKINAQPSLIYIHQDKLDQMAIDYNCDVLPLKQYCLTYLFLIEQNVLYKKHKKLLEHMPSYAKAAYETGEINFLEQEKIELYYMEFINEINKFSYKISIAENEIKTLLDTTASIIPTTDTLKKYVSFRLSKLLKDQKNSKPDSNLSSFIIRENQMLSYYQLNDELNFYINSKLPYVNKFENQARFLLDEETIDIMEYYDLLKNVFSIKNDYLILLNQFNQLVIKIEHYEEINF